MAQKKKPTFGNDYLKLMARVSENIQKIRLKQDFTQEDMLALGFERRWFQRIESGNYSISLPTLHRLAKAMKVDVSEFFKKNN